MARVTTNEAEALLDKEIKVLDRGFVRLVDYLGGDARIVQAARVSYGPGTKSLSEDAALINYLLKNEHTSPFEQVVMTFHVKTPIFVARQWVRHRTARMNEVSGRYSVMADEFYMPEAADVHSQSRINKQARSDELVDDAACQDFLRTLKEDQTTLYSRYSSYVKNSIARELARINLPLSLYTEFYWQIDLHNLFHFLKLRLNPSAQKEIRVYAEVLASCARAVAPMAYTAFETHVVGSVRLSQTDCELLRSILESNGSEASLGILEKLPAKREE